MIVDPAIRARDATRPANASDDPSAGAGSLAHGMAGRVLVADSLAHARATAHVGRLRVRGEAGFDASAHASLTRRILGCARLPAMTARPDGFVVAELSAVADALRGVDLAGLLPELAGCAPRRLLSFAAGRLCAEAALLAAGGELEAIGRDAAGAPIWPDGWVGSISHDERYAVARVHRRATLAGVGVDVEKTVEGEAFDALVATCLTAAERRRVAASAHPGRAATIAFSAKEAYYKAVHPQVRRFVDFLEVEVEIDDEARTLRVGAAPMHRDASALPRLLGRYHDLDPHVLTVVELPPVETHQRSAARQLPSLS